VRRINKQSGGFSSSNPYGGFRGPAYDREQKVKAYLYGSPVLHSGFKFPQQYIDFAITGCSQELYPWSALAADMASSLYYFGSMLLKFQNNPLDPFAIIHDETGLYNDGWIVLACFDGADFSGNPPVRIYGYSNPKVLPWENKSYKSFSDWLEAAKKESSDYRSSLC